MNTCARLEATGVRNRIHTAGPTAQLLIKAGKEAWVEKLEATTDLKGKGLHQTYFVNVAGDRAGSVASRASLADAAVSRVSTTNLVCNRVEGLDDRNNRLINWNVEMLLQLLKQIVASRSGGRKAKTTASRRISVLHPERTNPLEEVREIITLPEFDSLCGDGDPEKVQIPKQIIQQLHLLVSEIAQMYNDNPFHNFVSDNIDFATILKYIIK